VNDATSRDPQAHGPAAGVGSHGAVAEALSSELFFAVVGPVGAGSSRAARALARRLAAAGLPATILKASEVVRAWARAAGDDPPGPGTRTLTAVAEMQRLGAALRERSGDNAAVAIGLAQAVARARATLQGGAHRPGEAVAPDGRRRAFVIDSLKHPDEVRLLRRLYGEAFALIGVVCGEAERERRMIARLFPPEERQGGRQGAAARAAVRGFMQREANEQGAAFGQDVTAAFHDADLFVDNTPDDPDGRGHAMDGGLGRLISVLTGNAIHRPTVEETAMQTAHAARLRSACLSRQVGAALVDRGGNIVATGANEVPRAGGGVYGEGATPDERCLVREPAICSNNVEQNQIIRELIAGFPELTQTRDPEAALIAIRRTRLGRLLEFSRSVHAEMEAILAAARVGVSPVGGRLFCTTFPCHYCARHIVGAGIHEVQYIEPYRKSRALDLHDDAIETDPSAWQPPDGSGRGKVLFRPFVGIAPRLFARAFLRDRELKHPVTGAFAPEQRHWGPPAAAGTVGYPELEARLSRLAPWFSK
jgi:deoxycytidylate deaminase